MEIESGGWQGGSVTLFGGSVGTGDDSYTVSALGDAISRAVRVELPNEVWVRGEIRDLTRARSGHVYLRLVEAGSSDRPGGTVTASVSVMLSARNKAGVNRTLRDAGAGRLDDGTQVKIRGRVDWYGPRGQLQLLMTAVDPIYTLGQLAAERAAVVRSLREDGVFDANRLVRMPLLPLHVGLVTSLGSDAERDVLDELTRSGFGFRISCVDARVQGEAAPTTVAAGIAMLDGRVDVIVVARGGGGATDLQAFDSERVARAICLASVPVLTGIGHESDVSVADEVAHENHKTPTAVAQALVARVTAVSDGVESSWRRIAETALRSFTDEVNRMERLTGAIGAAARTASAAQHHRLERFGDRLTRAGEHSLVSGRHSLERCGQRLLTASQTATTEQQRRLDTMSDRIVRAAPRALRGSEEEWRDHATTLRRIAAASVREADRHVESLAGKVDLLDPARSLARGWSITRRSDGSIVRTGADVATGEEITTTVGEGELTSTVTKVHLSSESAT